MLKHPLFYNQQEARPRALVRLAVQTALYYSANTLIYAFLGTLFIVAWPRLLATQSEEPSPAFTFVAALITGLVILASVWVAGRYLDRRPFAHFGLHLDRAWWLDLLFGLALGALLMAGIFGVQRGAGWLTVTGVMVGGGDLLLGLAGALMLYVTVGVYEEVLFRGYRMRNLAEGLRVGAVDPRWALLGAWLLSSAWFGLAHRHNPNATLISSLNLALAGLFLGLGYLLTGRLGLPIGLHITWNFFQGNVFGFPVSGTRIFPVSVITVEQGGPLLWTGGAFGPEAGLLGILAILIGCLAIWAWVSLRQGRASLDLALTRYLPPPNDQQESTRVDNRETRVDL